MDTLYRVAQKSKQLILLFINLAYVDQFENSFTVGVSKFAIKQLSCFPAHINYVATLPCKTLNATFIIYHYSCYKNLH